MKKKRNSWIIEGCVRLLKYLFVKSVHTYARVAFQLNLISVCKISIIIPVIQLVQLYNIRSVCAKLIILWLSHIFVYKCPHVYIRLSLLETDVSFVNLKINLINENIFCSRISKLYLAICYRSGVSSSFSQYYFSLLFRTPSFILLVCSCGYHHVRSCMIILLGVFFYHISTRLV